MWADNSYELLLKYCARINKGVSRSNEPAKSERVRPGRKVAGHSILYIPNNMYAHSNKAFAPSTAITRVFTQKYSYWLTNRDTATFS